MSTPAISVQDVFLSYSAEITVLNKVSLDVRQGGCFGLIGLNGAGKTSLLKLILGLRDDYDGEINVLDHKAGSVEAKYYISYLPERFDPPWYLMAEEFLKSSLRLRGQDYDFQKTFMLAERLQLDPVAFGRRVQDFSKGMRQKLGLLSAVLSNAPLLILDEPMSGLDPASRKLFKNVLMALKEEGRTIFLSSHILADIEEVCDEIAILHNGHIVHQGAPETIMREKGEHNLERAFLECIENTKVA